MALKPVVRYMLLCDDWERDPDNLLRVTIHGLISNIHSVEDTAYPLLYRELCVFLMLTECRGQGEAKIVCVFEESGERIFETPSHALTFGNDPLEVVSVSFRIRDCSFPQDGLYSVQFWYGGEVLEERPLRLR